MGGEGIPEPIWDRVGIQLSIPVGDRGGEQGFTKESSLGTGKVKTIPFPLHCHAYLLALLGSGQSNSRQKIN